jgi:hypothetical protein
VQFRVNNRWIIDGKRARRNDDPEARSPHARATEAREEDNADRENNAKAWAEDRSESKVSEQGSTVDRMDQATGGRSHVAGEGWGGKERGTRLEGGGGEWRLMA